MPSSRTSSVALSSPRLEEHGGFAPSQDGRDLGALSPDLRWQAAEGLFSRHHLIEPGIQVRTRTRADRFEDRDRQCAPARSCGHAGGQRVACNRELRGAPGSVLLSQRKCRPRHRGLSSFDVTRHPAEEVAEETSTPADEYTAEPELVHQDPRRHRPCLGGNGVLKGSQWLTVSVQPLGRRPVQLSPELWMFEGQLTAQELPEQRLVAITARLAGDGLEERVAVRHELEHSGLAALTGERRRQPWAQRLDEAGPQQELADPWWLLGVDLAHQVGGHVPGVAAELANGLRGVHAAHERHRRELQPRRPPAGPGSEHDGVDRCQVQPGTLQQRRGLRGAEGEVGSPDLGEAPAEPVAMQGKGRVGPRQEDKVQLLRALLDQAVHGLADGGWQRELVAVEHPHHGTLMRVDASREPRQHPPIHAFGTGRGGHAGHVHARHPRGFDGRGPEHRRRAVVLVHHGMDQSHGRPGRGCPGAHECGLAVTRRRAHQRHRAPRSSTQEAEQVAAYDHLRWSRRHVQPEGSRRSQSRRLWVSGRHPILQAHHCSTRHPRLPRPARGDGHPKGTTSCPA